MILVVKMPYKEYLLKHSNIQEYEGLDIESALEYEQGIKPTTLGMVKQCLLKMNLSNMYCD